MLRKSQIFIGFSNWYLQMVIKTGIWAERKIHHMLQVMDERKLHHCEAMCSFIQHSVYPDQQIGSIGLVRYRPEKFITNTTMPID